MRVVLFDIDGTLILTGRAGQFAMSQVARNGGPAAKDLPERAFAGRTDRAIIADYFRLHGIDDTPENFARFCEHFLGELPRQLRERQGLVLPGVRETLDHLRPRPDLVLGLLTGNLRRAAWLKLRHYKLDHYFFRSEDTVLGAFGDEHLDRDDVARSALRSIHQALNQEIEPSRVWVVGDTPLDVRCARAIGANCLAVATGGYSPDELHAAGPDLVLPTLELAQQWLSRL